jgi:hypothetical protein
LEPFPKLLYVAAKLMTFFIVSEFRFDGDIRISPTSENYIVRFGDVKELVDEFL